MIDILKDPLAAAEEELSDGAGRKAEQGDPLGASTR